MGGGKGLAPHTGGLMFAWIRSWWITWRVWRNADAEQRAIITGPFNPGDYVEVERPS